MSYSMASSSQVDSYRLNMEQGCSCWGILACAKIREGVSSISSRLLGMGNIEKHPRLSHGNIIIFNIILRSIFVYSLSGNNPEYRVYFPLLLGAGVLAEPNSIRGLPFCSSNLDSCYLSHISCSRSNPVNATRGTPP